MKHRLVWCFLVCTENVNAPLLVDVDLTVAASCPQRSSLNLVNGKPAGLPRVADIAEPLRGLIHMPTCHGIVKQLLCKKRYIPRLIW